MTECATASENQKSEVRNFYTQESVTIALMEALGFNSIMLKVRDLQDAACKELAVIRDGDDIYFDIQQRSESDNG